MELKETEDIKEGNVLGSLKDDDVMSRCVYPFNRIVVNPHGFVVACTADFHKKPEIGDTTKKTLLEICKVESSPSTYHLGYVLGPRINAGGRVGKSSHGANLLLNTDPKNVFKIASKMYLTPSTGTAIPICLLTLSFEP